MLFRKTVLIVEDEDTIARSQARKIEDFGYEALIAGSGEMAIELSEQSAAIGLVLMDIDLGRGMSGPEAAKRILSRRRLPIVFMSSRAEREVIDSAKGIPRYGYVIKGAEDIAFQTSIEMAFDLFEANESLRIQHELSLALNAGADLRQGLESVLATVLQFESIDSGGVYLADPVSGALDLMAHRGLSPEFIGIASHYPPETPDVLKARSGECRYGSYSEIRPATDEIRRREGLRALASIPVVNQGRLIALLNLASHTHDSIPEKTRIALETLALQIGCSLMRLHADSILRESEEKYRLLVRNSHDAIYSLDAEGVVLFISPAWTTLLGYPEEKAIGRTFERFIHPDDAAACRTLLKSIIDTGNSLKSVEYRARHLDGTWYWHDSSVAPFRDQSGAVVGVYGIARDITERKRAEERIKGLLSEKELLLKEVHHRVKNSMQMMTSILSLQISGQKDPISIAALQDARTRIQSMEMLYDRLNLSEDLRKVSIASYLGPLIDEIVGNFPDASRIRIDKRIDSFMLNANAMSYLGIIVNELLTNAIKYAFLDADRGSIKVTVSLAEGRATLVVQDDGKGIPESIDFDRSPGFGLTLIGLLAKQMGGSTRIERGEGTRIIFEFEV